MTTVWEQCEDSVREPRTAIKLPSPSEVWGQCESCVSCERSLRDVSTRVLGYLSPHSHDLASRDASIHHTTFHLGSFRCSSLLFFLFARICLDVHMLPNIHECERCDEVIREEKGVMVAVAHTYRLYHSHNQQLIKSGETITVELLKIRVN